MQNVDPQEHRVPDHDIQGTSVESGPDDIKGTSYNEVGMLDVL